MSAKRPLSGVKRTSHGALVALDLSKCGARDLHVSNACSMQART
jgi:hypothetical protein